jgi:predicted methyltransferase
MNLDYKFKHILTEKDKKNILFRLVKGEKLQRIADRYGLTVAFLRRNFNHYIKDSSIEKVKLGYKNEPYYNNEMDYGFMPSYNVDGLSAPELKIYNEI